MFLNVVISCGNVCCPPGRKTLRPVFSRRVSDANWVSYVHTCVRCASFQTKIQFATLKYFLYCRRKMLQKKNATYQRILHQLLHFDKTSKCRRILHQKLQFDAKCVDIANAFCNKKSKCTNCNIDAKCVLHQCNNWYILIFFVTKCVGNVDAFCIKIIDAKCVDMVHIDAFCNKKILMHLVLIWNILRQNLTVRKQNLLASGPLLIMRLNYYSKEFGCVGCFQA